MNIRTEHVYPPIPIRSFDWSAVDDDTYDGPGSPIGTGATEAEAVADLKEQLGIEVQQQRLTCTSLVPGRVDRWEECGRDAEHECVYCHDPLCILCLLGCAECAEPLHDHCREEHADESGHQVDDPPKKQPQFVHLLNREIDRVDAVLEPK